MREFTYEEFLKRVSDEMAGKKLLSGVIAVVDENGQFASQLSGHGDHLFAHAMSIIEKLAEEDPKVLPILAKSLIDAGSEMLERC